MERVAIVIGYIVSSFPLTRVTTASLKRTLRTKQLPLDPDGIGGQRRAFLDQKVPLLIG